MLVFVASIFSMNTRDQWAHIQSTLERKASPLRGGVGLIMQHDIRSPHMRNIKAFASTRHRTFWFFHNFCLFSRLHLRSKTIRKLFASVSNLMVCRGSGSVVPVNKIIQIFKSLREWVREKWNLGLYLPAARGFLEFLVSVNNVRTQFSPGQGCVG